MSPGGAGAPASGASQAGGNQANCPDCPPRDGIARWHISEPYENLIITDEPLSYRMSTGQRMVFRWHYKQRYQLPQPDECPTYYSYGSEVGLSRGQGDNYGNYARTWGMTNAAWAHNWMMDVVFWDAPWEQVNGIGQGNGSGYEPLGTASAPCQNEYEALVFRPEGGIWYFANTNATDPVSQTQLQPLSSLGYPTVASQRERDGEGIYWGEPATNGFRLLYPDGSQDVLSLTLYLGTLNNPPFDNTTARAYLTQRIDPQGRVTRVGYEKTNFVYDAYGHYYVGFRVRYVVDPDGRTNKFAYQAQADGAQHPWQAIEVDDPFGRKAQMSYSGGVLTGIVDAQTNSSSFSYQDSSGWVSGLTTPYGSTSFTHYQLPDPSVTNGFTERAVYVSEPQGAQQLFFYLHNTNLLAASAAAPSVPGWQFDDGTTGGMHCALTYRNTFHWDRRQFAALSVSSWSNLPGALSSLTAEDYRKASLQHWLLGGDGVSVTESVSSQRDPSPDAQGQDEAPRLWYGYANKPSPEVEGDAQVGCIGRVLPDGSSQYAEWDYTTNGLPLQQRESYSLAGGSVDVRTNAYQYSTNAIDLLSVTNSLGQYVNLGYNTNHQVLFATNALGQVDHAAYDPSTGHLTNLAVASGLSVAVAYYPSNGASPNGGMISNVFWSPLGLSVTATWTNGLPRVMHVNGTGLPDLWQTNAWDGLNRLVGTAFRDGTSVSNVYDRLHLGASKDRRGYWTSFGWDALEDLIAITDALSNQTQYGWCDCGALDSITDALTNTTSLFYNNQGIWTNITFADNSSLTRTLDALGRPVVVADGQGRWLAGAYNNQGSLVTLSNAAGLMWSVVLDAADRPVQVTFNGVTHTNTWNPLDQLLTRTWLSGGTPAGIEGFLWRSNGLAAWTNQNSKVTCYLRDGAGRPLYVTNANQEVIQLAWNALNELTDLWDGRTNHTGWGYDEYGWLTNQVDASNHVVLVLARDPNGQVTNRWTRQFGNTVYRRDPTGWVTNLLYVATGQSVSYALDALHQVIGMADQVGTTQFGHTPTGQLQSETAPWPGSTLTLGYTEGLRTSLSLGSFSVGYHYDSAWRLDTLTSPAGTFNYSYPASGLPYPATLLLPNRAWVTNHYDALARLDYTALVNPWGHVLDGYAYGLDLLGLRTNIVRDLGLTTSSVSIGYDNTEQITSWSAREPNGALRQNEQYTWQWDKAGNARLVTRGSLAETFGCDSLNQITNITRTGTLTVSGATPVPATNVTVNGISAECYGDFTFACTNLALTNGQNMFTIVAQNAYGVRATNSAIYNLPSAITLANDSNGNLTNDGTRSFAYSPENQLTNITVAGQWKVDFVHDGLGRRRIGRDYAWQGGTWQLTNELHFLYDGYLPIQGRDTNNNVLWTLTRGVDLSGSLVGAGGIGGLVAHTDTNGSTFYHADAAGNITGMIDGRENMAARYMYAAFGSLILQGGPSADANTMGFSSMPRMKGLVSFSARDYSTDFLRFLTQDPLGIGGGPNPYQFVGNNPISNIDPLGLSWYVDPPASDGSYGPPNAHWADDAHDWIIQLPLPADGGITDLSGDFMLMVLPASAAKPLFNGALSLAKEMRQENCPGPKWSWPQGKGVPKMLRQLQQRGWTPQQISEAIQSGERFPADNLVNPGNGATRFVHPTTGQSVVTDNVTGEVLHVGGPGFLYPK
jgi:RHS repeat-associated protein